MSKISEWFDDDRRETMTIPLFDTPDPDPLPFDYDDEKMNCPQCGSDALEYKGEAYDDEYHQGSAYKCDECGLHFTEKSLSDGTW